ncbi:MAG: MBL fold metallo-hydrolase, partial [Bacteroidales bacterium]|nr:MBL fold metallo-hydrolase [Bacteroidales bacterium]
PGLKKISIFGTEHSVRANIRLLEAFSGHGDYVEMADFISCQDKNLLKKIFLVHGDLPSAEHYRKYLLKKEFKNIEIPKLKDEFEL